MSHGGPCPCDHHPPAQFLYDIFPIRQMSILLDGHQYRIGRSRHHPPRYLLLLNPQPRPPLEDGAIFAACGCRQSVIVELRDPFYRSYPSRILRSRRHPDGRRPLLWRPRPSPGLPGRAGRVDPSILAREVQVISSHGGFEITPARVTKIMSNRLAAAVANRSEERRVGKE